MHRCMCLQVMFVNIYIVYFVIHILNRNMMVPLQETSMSSENRIQVLKSVPLNIVLPGNQLNQDKRGLFPTPDTTVTVSIAAVPNYPVKTEGPSHGFSVTVPNPHCSESDGHAVVFDRQLPHNQFSPNTQPRTPDSTFPENSDVSSHTHKHTNLLSPTLRQYFIYLATLKTLLY